MKKEKYVKGVGRIGAGNGRGIRRNAVLPIPTVASLKAMGASAKAANDILNVASAEVRAIVCPKCGEHCHLPARTITEFVIESGSRTIAVMSITDAIKLGVESVVREFSQGRQKKEEKK